MRSVLTAAMSVAVLAATKFAFADPPHVTNSRLLAQPASGKNLSVPLTVSGGAPPYSYALIAPPSGFAVDATGTITGKSVPAGLTPLVVLVTDSAGAYEQRSLDVFAVDTSQALAVQTPPTMMPGVTGQTYDVALSASGGTPPLAWSVSGGSLPMGMALDAGGRLSGAPSAAGASSFTVQVTDAAKGKATASMSLRIDDGTVPFAVTMASGAPVQTNIARIGYNIDEGPVYYTDQGYSNQYLNNPSFEVSPPERQMHLIESGTANSLTTWTMNNGFFDEPDGFYTGGQYWVLSGPAAGRAGTITTDKRVSLTNDTQYQRVVTLADSNANEIPTTVTGSSSLNNDVMMLESLAYGSSVPAPWKAWGAAPGTVAVDTTVAHSGSQSLLISQTGAGELGAYQGVLFNGPLWRRLRSDTTYTFSIWVKQTGIASGQVTIGLTSNWNLTQPIAVQTLSVPEDGSFHQLTVSTRGHGESFVVAVIALQEPGKAWIDDALMYESSSTTNYVSDPPGPTTTAGPYDPIPAVVADLKRAHAGSLRFWYHDSHLRLADALTRATADAPGAVHNIYADLALAEAVGSSAWFCAEKEWMPEDYAALAEYLASTDTTKGMGQLRASQGHSMPWTATLPAIYIEYSDESWNWPFFGYPFDLWHAKKYSTFGQDRFNAIRSTPYKAANLFLVLDGQIGDDYWVNGPVEEDAYPAMDALDNAPYIQMPALPLDDTNRMIVGLTTADYQSMQGTLAAWSKAGHDTQLYLYESGPQAGAYNATFPFDARKDSMANVGPYIDLLAQMLGTGTRVLNQFVYQANPSWMAVTGASSRFRLPTSYAIQMWNTLAGGSSELAVTVGGPTIAPLTLVKSANGTSSSYMDGTAAPAVTTHAYSSQGHVSFGLINRNTLATYSVQLPAEEGQEYVVTTLGGVRSDVGALEGPGLVAAKLYDVTQVREGLSPTQKSVVAGTNLLVTIPPAGIVTVIYGAASDGGEAGTTTDGGPGEPDAMTLADGGPTTDGPIGQGDGQVGAGDQETETDGGHLPSTGAKGGCSCRMTGNGRKTPMSGLAIAGLALALSRRRRRS